MTFYACKWKHIKSKKQVANHKADDKTLNKLIMWKSKKTKSSDGNNAGTKRCDGEKRKEKHSQLEMPPNINPFTPMSGTIHSHPH